MAKISNRISESLSEYLILTNWVKTRSEKVSLETKLGESISLQYPFVTARMQSVVGPEMAVAAGKNGILTVVPRSLNDDDKEKIISANEKSRLSKGEIEYVDRPVYVESDYTWERVLQTVDRVGHSIIPVIDKKDQKLLGVYIHDPDNSPMISSRELITHDELMQGLKYTHDESQGKVPYLGYSDISTFSELDQHVKEILQKEKISFLPILGEDYILRKMAFLQKYDTNFIGIAISSNKEKWKNDLERWGGKVDTICIDSSNACFDEALKILEYFKSSSEFKNKPFGIGNIIKGEDFKVFAEHGADYIIGGLGVGSICRTGSERGNGRGQMTVALELAQARDDFFKEKRKYVQLVLDGGIRNYKDMVVALSLADLIMMGNFFNSFYESAARKFDEKGNPTHEEPSMRYVETWGEGHPRARLVFMFGSDYFKGGSVSEIINSKEGNERYGHVTLSGSTVEGVLGKVKYRGRLKPNVEEAARYIKTTISNSGASDLESFRENAILEKASSQTLKDMLPHDVDDYES